MAAAPPPDPPPDSGHHAPPFPRVPAHAWAWLQRSRPVLAEAARRLTGAAPTPGFVDALRSRFEVEDFTRRVLLDAIADVAFAGRVPRARPVGVSWDRGLTWWAAALAGTTPAAFDAAPGVRATQRPLFGAEAGAPEVEPVDAGAQVPWLRGSDAVAAERRALAAALRELVRAGDGEAIPTAAVHRLLAALKDDPL